MGRSVHERHVALTAEQQDALALGAVADETGVPVETLRANLARLLALVPPLAARRARGAVTPAALVRIALDLPAVAAAGVRVKRILPRADAAAVCAALPALMERPEALDRAEAVVEALAEALEDERTTREAANANAPDGRRRTQTREESESDSSSPSAAAAGSAARIALGDGTTRSSRALAEALAAAVPALLATETDAEVAEAARRCRTLEEVLPRADLARLFGARPEFLTTPDAGLGAARGGHAAGLERGRTVADRDRAMRRRRSRPPRKEGRSSGGFGDAGAWRVGEAAAEMRRRMPRDCDVDRLLTDFPGILAMDVPAMFEDLERAFPGKEPGEVLRRNPKIATQVSDPIERPRGGAAGEVFSSLPRALLRFFFFFFPLLPLPPGLIKKLPPRARALATTARASPAAAGEKHAVRVASEMRRDEARGTVRAARSRSRSERGTRRRRRRR